MDKLLKYNEHDYETIPAFLKIKYKNGMRNGEGENCKMLREVYVDSKIYESFCVLGNLN